MNELQIFSNPQFGEIRTVNQNNEVWFVGKDVAEVLGYSNTRDALAKHVDDEDKASVAIHDGSQNRNVTIINESGLYSLMLSSKLENARAFKRWVTSEVLPTMRKTGGYVSNDDMFINTYLPFADDTTKALFKATLQTINQQNKMIDEQRKEITHKENVIIGLVGDIDLATKRQRITQIVRKGANGNYSECYNLLYGEFERKYHVDLERRISGCDIKPKIKNKMDYIDRVMQMIPELYEITCKLFENDVEQLKKEWETTV